MCTLTLTVNAQVSPYISVNVVSGTMIKRTLLFFLWILKLSFTKHSLSEILSLNFEKKTDNFTTIF